MRSRPFGWTTAVLCGGLLASSISQPSWARGARERSPRQPEIHEVLLDARHSTPNYVSGRLATAAGADRLSSALEYFERQTRLYRIESPARELRLRREATDPLGYRHLRLDQVYRGLRVWGCQQVVHMDPLGETYLVAGQSIPTPDHVNLVPTLVRADAQTLAVADVGGRTGRLDLVAESEQIVFPDETGARLAWLVTVTVPGHNGFRWRVVVDAHTGLIVLRYSDVPTDGPVTGSGIDVQGGLQNLHTYESAGTYRMIDATYSWYTGPVDSLTGVVVTYDNWRGGGPITTDPDSDNVFDDDPTQRAAVSAHYYAQLSMEYLRDVHGMSSYDDSGSTLRVSAHDSTYVNNAFWGLDSSINFGEGDGVNWRAFSGGLDVVAHELGHGVSVHGPGLIYLFAAGALHEHLSDFMGCMLDRDDWIVGEDISLTGGFVRDLSDPAASGLPDHISEYVYLPGGQDAGGAHTNCGIGNKATFLIADQLDRERAEQIVYRAWLYYLTPTSDYPFYALSLMQSARDLYGDPSVELAAVTAALDSVGLSELYATPAVVTSLPITLGTSVDTSLVVFNLGNTAVQIDSIQSSHAQLTVTGTLPTVLAQLDTAAYAITFDATGLASACDVGPHSEMLSIYTSSVTTPVIAVPITVEASFIDSTADTTHFSTSCMDVGVHPTPGLDDMVRDGIDGLFDASLLLGMIDGTDTLLFWDLDEYPNFTPVDSFIPVAAPPGLEARSLRWVSPESRLHGTLVYTWAPGGPDCDHFRVDYVVHNDCDTTLTFFAGLFADFDLPSFTINHGVANGGRELIMVRDDLDTRACGLANLSGESYNLRSINNPALVWDGFTAPEAYTELAATGNTDGVVADDWSALLTFGQYTLAPGDSAVLQAALIYSNTGTAGVIATAEALGAGDCIVTLTGDVNASGNLTSADVIALVNFVFKAGPPPLPILEVGDANCDGSVTSADIIRMVNYIFKSAEGPCDVCSIL